MSQAIAHLSLKVNVQQGGQGLRGRGKGWSMIEPKTLNSNNSQTIKVAADNITTAAATSSPITIINIWQRKHICCPFGTYCVYFISEGLYFLEALITLLRFTTLLDR